MSDLFSKVGIDLGVVVLLLIVLIIVMMIMTVSMSLRLSRLNQKYRSFMKGKDAQSLEKLFHQRFKEIDKLNKQNELTKKNLADLKKIQGMTLNKYGIVKYDAFDDVGGKMSFALAMLDKENTGFILNAIHSRDNCFLLSERDRKRRVLYHAERRGNRRAAPGNYDEFDRSDVKADRRKTA